MGFPGSSAGKESAYNAGNSTLNPGSGRSPEEGVGYPLEYSWASLVTQTKRIRLQRGRPGFNPWVVKIPWRTAWQPTLVFLPRELLGQRSLAGYSLQGHEESDPTELLSQQTAQLRSHRFTRLNPTAAAYRTEVGFNILA